LKDRAGEAYESAKPYIQEKANEAYETAKPYAESAKENMYEKAQQLKEGAQEKFVELKERAEPYVDSAKEMAKEKAAEASDTISEKLHNLKERAAEAARFAGEKLMSVWKLVFHPTQDPYYVQSIKERHDPDEMAGTAKEKAAHGARVAEEYTGEKLQQLGEKMQEDAHEHDDL